MANAIYSKADAIKKYDRQKENKTIKLFQEDMSSKGNKRFFVSDPKIIYDKMINNETNHFYEFWTKNMKIAFALINCPKK